jgi:hypothetical protein
MNADTAKDPIIAQMTGGASQRVLPAVQGRKHQPAAAAAEPATPPQTARAMGAFAPPTEAEVNARRKAAALRAAVLDLVAGIDTRLDNLERLAGDLNEGVGLDIATAEGLSPEMALKLAGELRGVMETFFPAVK